MAKKDYGTVTAMLVPSGEKKKTKKDYGTAMAMQVPSGWKKNARGTLKGGLAEYNKLKNKYGTQNGAIDSRDLTVWDGSDDAALKKRRQLAEKIEGSTRRETVGLRTKGKRYYAGKGYTTNAEGREASSEAHPYSYSDGFKTRNVTKADENKKFKVPAAMRKNSSTYSPEKDKERVLKKVYDGMYVYGKQKKKK
jgi:hypothetical protein